MKKLYPAAASAALALVVCIAAPTPSIAEPGTDTSIPLATSADTVQQVEAAGESESSTDQSIDKSVSEVDNSNEGANPVDSGETEDNPSPSDSTEATQAIQGSGTVEDSTTDEVAPQATASEPNESKAVAEQTQITYRLYNPYTGEHFFTASGAERDHLVQVGWSYEGEGWTAPVKSSTPVYRLYNSYAPGGDHHYTTSYSEYEQLVKLHWTGEGIGWYSADGQGIPLYREYNPYASSGTHHYTTNLSERLQIVAVGWRYEGVAWYGVTDSSGLPSANAAGQARGSDGDYYYVKKNGAFASDEWIDGKWYGHDYKMARSGVADCAGSVYSFDANGSVQTGWQTIGTITCYFDPSKGGKLAIGYGLTSIGGEKYYLGASGERCCGWRNVGDSRYYMNDNGAAVTGYVTIGGRRWHFDSDGKLYTTEAVLESCKRVPTPGPGLCSEWVDEVFNDAGLDDPDHSYVGDACDMFWWWCKSTDRSALKPGMIIAVPSHTHTWAGSQWGHVCIYMGNGQVMDNVGYIRTKSLDEWLSYYTTTYTPKWGWYGNIVLH